MKLWKILNVKDPYCYLRLNDPDRRPIQSPEDDSLKYLEGIANAFEKMKGGHGNSRYHSLTTDTLRSLLVTLRGISALARKLLSHDECKYALLGSLQSDELEGEFGI